MVLINLGPDLSRSTYPTEIETACNHIAPCFFFSFSFFLFFG